MTTVQIKNKLIRKIKSIENPELLEELSRYIDLELEDTEIVHVPDEVKKKIIQGQKDIKEGRYLTNEQANKEIDKWLKK